MAEPIKLVHSRGPREPWEQMPGEKARAFAAFETYLSMPPAERTVLGAYRLFVGNAKAMYASVDFRGWKRDFVWEDRAEAWDAALARDRRKGLREGAYHEAVKQGQRLQGEWAEYEVVAAKVVRVVDKVLDRALAEDSTEGNLTQVASLLGRLQEQYRLRLELDRERDRAGDDASEEDQADELDREIAELLRGEDAGPTEAGTP